MTTRDKEQSMTGTSGVALEPRTGDPLELEQALAVDQAGGPDAHDAHSKDVSRDRADEPIAEAIDRGDRQRALILCAHHHAAAVGRLCMAMVGSQQDAEDLTQETMLDAYHGFEGWRRDGSMRSWLMAIARRKCARHAEKRARRTAKLRLVHDAERAIGSGGGGAEAEVLLKQRAERARDALEALRPSEREALLLRFGAGLSFREVGLAIGIDEPAARKRVSRAIQNLRDALREEGTKP